MHRCSSTSHGNSYNPCTSCGFYQAPSNSFSMFFSMPNHQQQQFDHEVDAYTITPSSSVDCTLSLGTPSTRQTNYNFMDHQYHHHHTSNNMSSSSSSGSKKLSWDIFQTKKPSSSGSTAHKSNRGGSNGQDPLLARRCANCDTTSTPLWRNGPRGPKSLCNACGIRYKKEERRAATSATSTATASSTVMDTHHYMGHHHHMNSWVHQGNEFRFIEDNDNDSADNGIPFLSWRLNVPADRASLVHDYS